MSELPRLLAGIRPRHAMTLEEHLDAHGQLPTDAGPLADELEQAGLRGCGGANFPVAAKLRAVGRAGGRPIVLVNGCEGEPASKKDRLLLERLPHLVLDGALLAARHLGAPEIVVAVEHQSTRAADAVAVAIAERPDLGRRGVQARIAPVPGGYVSGQETATIAAVDGGAPKPTASPPRPAERGLQRRPTLVSNVETLAHVALIARHGAGWFRRVGTPDEPGSRLVTLSGCVSRPGVFEVECGSAPDHLLAAAGGPSGPLRAWLLGGYAGRWVGPEHATLESGIVVAFPQGACPVAEVARVAGWLADESAGQCGPCVHGLGAIADALYELVSGGDRGGYAHLRRWCGLVTGRGACAHPDGAARFVASALELFAADFDDHARYGACEWCSRAPLLPLPDVEALAA